MAAQVSAVLLLMLLLSSGSGVDPERGRMELRRVRSLVVQPRYGECWARALEHLDTRCRDLTSETQSQIALRFTLCHLSSSGRDFPSCPEGSDVSRCTGEMDAVAFNTYTEFFTSTHSMCHFLQSEAWQSRAENTMHRLTESSAGVAEQLQSTRKMAEDLIDAQSAALQAQQQILNSGEELRVTLRDSTQGLRSVFSELSSVSREQQVVLSDLFSRVSFLHSFLLMEAHSLSSYCYNAAALCTSFLLTSTQRSSRARLVLLALVCVNFYLEKKIYQFVMSSDHPEHELVELLTVYVSVLRRFMVCVGVCVLLCVCVRYRDPVQQSLQVLQQLRETQRSLQEALQHAESLGEQWTDSPLRSKRRSERRRSEEKLRRRQRDEEEESSTLVSPTTDDSDLSHFSHISWSVDSFLCSTVNSSAADTTLQLCTTHNAPGQTPTTHNAPGQTPTTHNAPGQTSTTIKASVSPGRRRCSARPPSSALVYSILVEDKQPRYSLRSQRSETHRSSE